MIKNLETVAKQRILEVLKQKDMKIDNLKKLDYKELVNYTIRLQEEIRRVDKERYSRWNAAEGRYTKEALQQEPRPATAEEIDEIFGK